MQHDPTSVSEMQKPFASCFLLEQPSNFLITTFQEPCTFHAYATVHSSIKYVRGVHEKWMKKSMRTIFTQSFGLMRLSNLLVLLKMEFASITNYE